LTGHPGTTNRLETYDKVKLRRDSTLPYTLSRLRAMEAVVLQYPSRAEQRRQAATILHSYANARKAFTSIRAARSAIDEAKQPASRRFWSRSAISTRRRKQESAAFEKAIERVAPCRRPL
jgi:hypothetical protein